MCTLGRDWSALPRMPLPPLLNHFFRVFFFVFSRPFSPFISFVHATQPDDVRHLVVNHKVTINFSCYTFPSPARFSLSLSARAPSNAGYSRDIWMYFPYSSLAAQLFSVHGGELYRKLTAYLLGEPHWSVSLGSVIAYRDFLAIFANSERVLLSIT